MDDELLRKRIKTGRTTNPQEEIKRIIYSNSKILLICTIYVLTTSFSIATSSFGNSLGFPKIKSKKRERTLLWFLVLLLLVFQRHMYHIDDKNFTMKQFSPTVSPIKLPKQNWLSTLNGTYCQLILGQSRLLNKLNIILNSH